MMESMRIKINMYITYNTFLLTIFSQYIESVHRTKTKEKGLVKGLINYINYTRYSFFVLDQNQRFCTIKELSGAD